MIPSAATKNRWSVTANAVIALVLALGSFAAWLEILPTPSASIPADWGEPKIVGTSVRMVQHHGVYVVPVIINNENH